MKYKPRAGQTERTVLADVVPIDTPYVFGIFVGDICNFRCKYCVQSVRPEDSGEEEHRGARDLVRKFMTWETFLRVVAQLQEFPQRIRKILLSSIGEPLLHPRLADMIAYLNARNISDSYEIVSNASVLTPDLSRALVDAGLSRLCVSIQGMTADKYKDICGYRMDMEELQSNLRYFYEYSRGKCQLHIKTVDIALDAGEKDAFLSTFGAFCDTIHIDHVIHAFQDVNYEFLGNQEHGLFADARRRVDVCSPLFYTLYVTPAGDVVPCCVVPYAMYYGNVAQESLCAIWNGTKRRKLLELHLKKKRGIHPVCKGCVIPDSSLFSEDMLDDAAEEVLLRLSAKESHHEVIYACR